MSTSFADRKKTATSAETTVHLCLDLALHNRRLAAYRELERRRQAARRDSGEKPSTLDSPPVEQAPTVTEQLAVIDEIDAELEAKSEPYVLRKLRPHVWRELGERFPASEDAVKEAKERRAEVLAANPDLPAELLHRLAPIPDVDSEAFWPEAIAACSHDPKLTVDDVLWLRDGDEDDDDENDGWTGLPPEEFSKLIAACQDLHGSGVVVPKELLRIVATMPRGPNGTTPAGKASRSASSGAASRRNTNRTG